MKWRKRTQGTANQVGNAFPIPDKSEQQKKARLPRIKNGLVELGNYWKKEPSTFLVVYKDKIGEEKETEMQATDWRKIIKAMTKEGFEVQQISKKPKEEQVFDTQKTMEDDIGRP